MPGDTSLPLPCPVCSRLRRYSKKFKSLHLTQQQMIPRFISSLIFHLWKNLFPLPIVPFCVVFCLRYWNSPQLLRSEGIPNCDSLHMSIKQGCCKQSSSYVKQHNSGYHWCFTEPLVRYPVSSDVSASQHLKNSCQQAVYFSGDCAQLQPYSTLHDQKVPGLQLLLCDPYVLRGL